MLAALPTGAPVHRVHSPQVPTVPASHVAVVVGGGALLGG